MSDKVRLNQIAQGTWNIRPTNPLDASVLGHVFEHGDGRVDWFTHNGQPTRMTGIYKPFDPTAPFRMERVNTVVDDVLRAKLAQDPGFAGYSFAAPTRLD